MRQSSLAKVGDIDAVSISIDREIASRYDDVKIVADNIDDVVAVASAAATTAAVADNIDAITAIGSNIADIVAVNSNIADVASVADNIVDISAVVTNIDNINSVVATVVPNMAEILLADDRATTATSMAVTATTQAGLANTARVAAEVAKGVAETKATEAGLSAVAADLSADLAAASEAVATTKAGEASASATAAHASELAAAAILDTFDDRYLGAFANNPTVDNDGNALTSGALFFNTTTHNLRVYDAGLVDWIALSGVTFAGLQDVNLTSVATGDVLKWNGTDWVNTKTVGLNSLQLLGGVSTQGTMTWNADEETVDVVQNGAVLQLGQETQVHVRNSSGSSIADGKVVMATGTLGASGRITAGLYDGTADVKYVLGVATETIANGDDGKVTSFGKIRGINTSAWNEGDVLYTTTAGGLTNVVPVTGVKIAIAMVITKHAVNGVIMVRVNGVDELAYEPKNVNIQTHIASTSNPHSVTKAQVGLSNVDNTSDANKPISTTAATEFALKAPLASPALTGTPTAPTAVVGTSTTQLATTAFVSSEIANDTYLKGTLDTNGTIMSKAAFNALAAERRANRAGSGFDEWGRHPSITISYPNINEGMWTNPNAVNAFRVGIETSGSNTGISKTTFANSSINGSLIALKYINDTADRASIILPPAPTIYPYGTTLTTEQIASGVIKHADSSNSGLIVNGKFDVDTSGWSGIVAGTIQATLSWDLAKAKILATTAVTTEQYSEQIFNCVVGKKYIFEADITISGTTIAGLFVHNPYVATFPSITTSGRYQFEFTAISTTQGIRISIKNGSTSGSFATFDNISVFPADAISRSDLVFLESWHEDVSEKDFVYPLGNVQYLGGATDGLSTPANGAFSGFGTYSLFGNWQTSSALIGKGYVWSALTDAQKKAFVANPENNMYLDGDKVIQVRYRMRVVQGLSDTGFNTYPYNSYFNAPSGGGYIKPKGKITNISSDYGIADTGGIYGHGTVSWVSSLPWGNEVGVFSASDSSGDSNGLLSGSYNGQCFALPIALVHR